MVFFQLHRVWPFHFCRYELVSSHNLRQFSWRSGKATLRMLQLSKFLKVGLLASLLNSGLLITLLEERLLYQDWVAQIFYYLPIAGWGKRWPIPFKRASPPKKNTNSLIQNLNAFHRTYYLRGEMFVSRANRTSLNSRTSIFLDYSQKDLGLACFEMRTIQCLLLFCTKVKPKHVQDLNLLHRMSFLKP